MGTNQRAVPQIRAIQHLHHSRIAKRARHATTLVVICLALGPLLTSCQLPGTSTSTATNNSPVSYALPPWWRPCLQFDATHQNICTQWDSTKAPVTCDDTNYQHNTKVQAVLLTTWRGLQVCGPRPDAIATSDNYVVFTPNGSVEQEFECTELVKRYLLLAYGLPSIGGTNGDGIVDAYTTQSGSPFHKVSNDAAGDGYLKLFPAIGDVLSYATVHTSIVANVHVQDATQGDATIEVIEQNRSATGTETLQMKGWIIDQQVTAWMTPRPWSSPSYDLRGTWTVSQTTTETVDSATTGRYSYTWTMTLQQNGDQLTGTIRQDMGNPNGLEFALTGTISGTSVTLAGTRDEPWQFGSPGRHLTIHLAGSISSNNDMSGNSVLTSQYVDQSGTAYGTTYSETGPWSAVRAP